MDSYSDLFEKMNEQGAPEDILSTKIEQETWDLVTASKGEYWFHEDVIYSEYDVLNWLREYKPEFYMKAFVEPDIVEGSDALIDALKALDLMKDWIDVGEKDIQTPEEEVQWKAAIEDHE